MSPTPPSPTPSRPLDVGDVISAGFRLYGAHLKQYLGISLRATLWTLLPLIGIIPILPIALGVMPTSEPSPLLSLGFLLALVLFVVLLIFLLFYGLAKSLTNAALITRLAFGELLGQPESVAMAQRQVQPKMWRFLNAALLLGLIFMGVVIAILIISGLFLAIPLGILISMAGGTIEGNAMFVITLVLLGLIMLLIFSIFWVWLLARFWFPEAPLAVEDSLTALATIGRCWNLTKDYAWRIVLILSVAFCVTIPITLIVQVLTSILQRLMLVFVAESSPEFAVITVLLGNVLGILSGIFILPFWQAIKAVVYYDLRARKEGLDLQLRERELGL